MSLTSIQSSHPKQHKTLLLKTPHSPKLCKTSSWVSRITRRMSISARVSATLVRYSLHLGPIISTALKAHDIFIHLCIKSDCLLLSLPLFNFPPDHYYPNLFRFSRDFLICFTGFTSIYAVSVCYWLLVRSGFISCHFPMSH